MRESRRRDFMTGAAVGALAGFIVKDLDLTTLVSYWGTRSHLIVVGAAVLSVTWLTRLRKLAAPSVAMLFVLWLAVAYTPLTDWMARDLARRDEPVHADAVFVLASGLQEDGDLTTASMSRLVRGLELLGEGWAPKLILSELPAPAPRYRDAAETLMKHFGLEHEILTVGPTRNTHDEAVAVAEAARANGLEHIIVVTSPSHSRRASAALETEGVRVTSVPCTEVRFDFENLSEPFDADDHTSAFRQLVHERVGLIYYRMRGWIE